MRNTKKQRLMIEQNRSLFMIAVVSIAIIGIVSVAMLFSTGKSDDNKDSSIDDDGVVQDMDVVRNGK